MIPRNREHYSYSQINQFLRICPQQYAFQRIHKYKPEFVTEAMPFGSAIHRTAEYFWAKRMDGLDATEDELAELFADRWDRQVRETTNLKFQRSDFDTLLQQGQGMMRVYRQQFPDDVDIVDFNVPFQVPLVDQHGEVLEKPLVGEIDLLLRYGDRLCAVDLKTAAQRYSESKMKADLQPTAYLYALRMRGHDALFRWDVLLKTKKTAYEQYVAERSENDFYRMIELIKVMESMIKTGTFLPNEGSYFCPGCGHQTVCRQWHLHSVPSEVQNRELVTA